MNHSEIIIGHRVLVQSGAEVREHAKILGVNDNGLVIVRLSDNSIREIHPQYILKDFEV